LHITLFWEVIEFFMKKNSQISVKTSRMDLNDLELLGKAAGAIAAIFGLVKLKKPMKKFGSFLKACILAPIRIEKVIYELQPNGGTSLKDSVNRIEKNLALSAQKFAHSIDHDGKGFFQTNQFGDCIEVSPGYCRLVGKTESESLGKRWVYNIHPTDRNRIVQEWREAVANSAYFEAKYSLIDSDGEEVPVIGRASPLKNPQGEIVGYFGIVQLYGNEKA
jgi:PAS domain S-box-containing protein